MLGNRFEIDVDFMCVNCEATREVLLVNVQ